MYAQWLAIVDINRTLGKRISSKLKRHGAWQTVEPGAFIEVLDASDKLLTRSMIMRDHIRALPDGLKRGTIRQHHGVERSPVVQEYIILAVTASVLATASRYRIWKKCQKEAAAGACQDANSAAHDAAADSGDYEKQTKRIETPSGRLLIISVCTINDMLVERKDLAGFELRSHLSPFTPTQYTLDRWADVAMRLPHTEQGGPSQYPLSRKIEVTRNLITALRAQSFAWANRSEQADRCEAALQRVIDASAPHPPPEFSMEGHASDEAGSSTRLPSPSTGPSATPDQSGAVDTFQPSTFPVVAPEPGPTVPASSSVITSGAIDSSTGTYNVPPSVNPLAQPDAQQELADPFAFGLIDMHFIQGPTDLLSYNTANVPWEQLLAELSSDQGL